MVSGRWWHSHLPALHLNSSDGRFWVERGGYRGAVFPDFGADRPPHPYSADPLHCRSPVDRPVAAAASDVGLHPDPTHRTWPVPSRARPSFIHRPVGAFTPDNRLKPSLTAMPVDRPSAVSTDRPMADSPGCRSAARVLPSGSAGSETASPPPFSPPPRAVVGRRIVPQFEHDRGTLRAFSAPRCETGDRQHSCTHSGGAVPSTGSEFSHAVFTTLPDASGDRRPANRELH